MTDIVQLGSRGGGRRGVAPIVLAGSFLLAFQGGLLRVALPAIRQDLGTDIGGAQALSLAGLVLVTATVVAFGRLADVVGRRIVYSVGLWAFAAGTALSAVAPSLGTLILTVGLIGAGWSMCIATSLPLIVSAFREEERGRAISAQFVAVALGMGAGPGLGGVLVETLGWRPSLALLAPAGAALGGFAMAGAASERTAGGGARFDLWGSVLLGASLAGIVLLVRNGGGTGLAVLWVTGAAVGLFVWSEARSPHPLVELRLIARRGLAAGLAAVFLNFIAMAANMFLMPFFLQDHLGLGVSRAGLVMMVVPAAIVIVAPLGGALADRIGPRLPATAGEGMVTLGVALMATLGKDAPVARVVAVLALYGAGAGLFHGPNSSGALGSVPPGKAGVATGSLATFGRLGEVAGIAIAGAAWRAGLERYGTASQGMGWAFRDAFLLLAFVGLLATLTSWARGSGRAARTGAEPLPADGGMR